MERYHKIPFLTVLKHVRVLRPLVRTLYHRQAPALEKELMGIKFSGPLGVAAGIDKRGEFTDAIACYSPAFIEIGPLRDIRFAISQLQKRENTVPVFANLSNAHNLDRSFPLIYDFVDAIVLNISQGSQVSQSIDHLIELRRYNDEYKPVIFKIYPDITSETLDAVTAYMLGSGIDGVIVGAELFDRVRQKTQGLLPIIVSAEISSPERAAQLLDSGADLIAVTNSPFHYGPNLIKRIIKYLEKR
ncbi:MAG: hypothetical protein K6G79_06385 [Bacteroidales bacterium]|nr:hypothetical protein [Bacteroidales bacterium]